MENKRVYELYSVSILGAMVHSEKTKEILAPYLKKRKQGEFIRKIIMSFAIDRGFTRDENNIYAIKKPRYITTKAWQAIVAAQGKSYRIDYIYAIAFFWLLSLSEFKHFNKSKLMKHIISQYQHGHRQ